MIEYRAYALDSEGHIASSAPLVCRDDTEAIAKARESHGDRAIEVWSGERFVAKLNTET